MSMQQNLSRLWTRQLLAVAGQTFLAYDYLLTFPLEVDYIWRTQWCAVKVIFLLNRYGNLIGQSVFTLEELGVLSHGSAKFCMNFQWFIAFFGILAEESIHILVLLRAWAIWGCKYHVAVAMISAYVLYLSACVGMLVYAIVISTDEPIPFTYLAETGVCVAQAAPRGWLLPMVSLLLDSVVSVMIAYSLVKNFKGVQCFKRSPVLRVLARDAALYFAVNAAIIITAIICQTVYQYDPRNLIMVACVPLLTVTGQRLVLNLRRLKSRSYTEQIVNLNVDRRITAPRTASLWRSAERGITNQHQESERRQESNRIQMASEIELLTMEDS